MLYKALNEINVLSELPEETLEPYTHLMSYLEGELSESIISQAKKGELNLKQACNFLMFYAMRHSQCLTHEVPIGQQAIDRSKAIFKLVLEESKR